MRCGKPFGGVWISYAGIPIYHKLSCNDSIEHDFGCSYHDVRSGMTITQTASPTVTVDDRGCIRTS